MSAPALTELELAHERLAQSERNTALLCEALNEYLRLTGQPVVPGQTVLDALRSRIRSIQSDKDSYR